MGNTLEEVLFSNNIFSGCLPEEITLLNGTKVIDLSSNKLIGDLPEGLEYLQQVETLEIANNIFRGNVPETVCSLPNLNNFTFSSNYFTAKDPMCKPNAVQGLFVDDKNNCFPGKNQRLEKVCKAALSRPVNCTAIGCRPSNPGIGSKTPHKPIVRVKTRGSTLAIK
ncbi:Hypothetical predicted protein [Olea europaea subsp. europaea]|uniref:Uncharacterized protein n=1 Tax=Olea europaea subsp. europaea TaxID=158383 RepID=A0A8S0PNH8_OLEEU|nr:Hypothetical predicted protein [Olea europaea subsp. europaea]